MRIIVDVMGGDNALQVDVDNVRANFGIGLTYLERGESDKAENIFARLIKLDGAYEEEHKHLFNEFGISLRKNKMFSQSLEYYLRALDLTKKDENLYINIARVYLELKDIPHCAEFLGKALEIAPANETAQKFLHWLEAKRLLTPEQALAVRSAGSLSNGETGDEAAASPGEEQDMPTFSPVTPS